MRISALHADCPELLSQPPSWFPRVRALPLEWADWLFDPGSLTQRLRRKCPNHFCVHVLHQGWARPTLDETRALGLRSNAWAWIREVRLMCGEQPWVFARTLIPPTTLRGRGRRLIHLGNRPLGQVLFADPRIRRGPVEIARLVVGQKLHRRAFIGLVEPPDAIWGRRSIFWIDGHHPLLVCEIFLPALPVSPTLVNRIGCP